MPGHDSIERGVVDLLNRQVGRSPIALLQILGDVEPRKCAAASSSEALPCPRRNRTACIVQWTSSGSIPRAMRKLKSKPALCITSGRDQIGSRMLQGTRFMSKTPTREPPA